MKRIYRILLILHIVVGIGALFGGMLAILNPGGLEEMELSTEILRYSPFNTFLIPGLILFIVIGLGNLSGAATMLLKSKHQGYISSVFSWALVIWIAVQCIMLREIVFLHILFFVIGLVQAALSAYILLKQRLFPAGIVFKIIPDLEERF